LHNSFALPNLYDILGVPPKADNDAVRSAYRNLARTFHPDVNPDPKAHEKMAQINVAFEVLSDPVRRMEYDVSIGQADYSEPEASHRDSRHPDAVQVQVIHRHREHRTPVYAMSFHRASGKFVTASFDNELLWWDPQLSFVEKRVKLEGGVVSSVAAFGPNGALAAGTTEQSLACWTVEGERVKVWRNNPKEWVCTVAPAPDGQSLAEGTVDNTLRVVRASDGQVRFTGHAHTGSVTALAWTQDSARIATGSADASVKIWCGATGRELMTLNQVRSTVTSLAFSPDQNTLAVAAVDLSLRVFDLRNGMLIKTFFGHQRPIECLAFHPRSWLLASASRDGSVGLWNIVHGIGHGRIEASHQPVSCVGFSPSGDRLVAGGLDKVLRVWALSMPQKA
jgi:WD40 repeat protein